jgi:hypothetical protein
MPLTSGQVQVGDLVLGRGTIYTLTTTFNPFRRTVRAPAAADRSWGHGGTSGAEWTDQPVVPLQVWVEAGGDWDAWLAARHEFAAAFAAVGAGAGDVELRFRLGSRSYLMRGRPRMSEPSMDLAATGRGFIDAAFVATDPFIYTADVDEVQVGLPSFEGGLEVPLTVPFTVPGVMVNGRAELENVGTAEVGLQLRVDGPVSQPRVGLVRADGISQVLRCLFDVAPGQWVEIDTRARSVLLNGLPQASRRGQVTGEFPLLPPGVSTVRFGAAEHNDTAVLTVGFRSGWW